MPADKFIEKLCKFDNNINSVWIVNGEGEMLHIPPTTQTVSGNGNHDNNMINSCSTSAVEKKEVISHALGHGNNTVTDIYINFDYKKVDEANRKVIDCVCSDL